MTYDEAIAFWFGRINFETRSAAPADLKLERMRALLRLIGNPHERLRLVHITGTKGKGSTAAMLGSVLRTAGYRVGLYTSPHLEKVEERIQIDGMPISREELAAGMAQIAPAVRELESGPGSPPTFFEISTALGLLHFLQRRCDIAILEVGLGGRFDSTNVCRPLVSVITSVGFDHMAQLGNTLAEIAYQKAGIIKPGVPVVVGPSLATTPSGALSSETRLTDSPRSVIDAVAKETNSRIIDSTFISVPYELGLLGEHQRANAACALGVLQELKAVGFHVPVAAIANGLKQVRWPARIELISSKPAVILDSAHNVPSAEALVHTLRQSVPVAGTKRIVFAVSNDKQYEAILGIFAEYFDEFFLTKYGNNPRCVPPEKLAEYLPNTPHHIFANATDAWLAARSASNPTDLICITGSVFLAGELQAAVRPRGV